LVTSQPDNLLPALLSRLQKIYFGRLSDSEMGKVVKEKQIIELSFGRPGRAVRLLSDPLTKEGEQYAAKFLKQESAARSGLIKELVDRQKENPELLDRFFESLILKLKKDPVANFREMKSVLNRLFLIKSYNTNKRLQLEAI
jgi:predicted CopG family antitoxin